MTRNFESYREVIPEFSRFQSSLRNPAPVYLRVNTLKAEPGRVLASLRRAGITLEESGQTGCSVYRTYGLKSPGNLMEYFLGHIHPQAITSCLASHVLSPSEGSCVLDMCAAPGGKTSHLAQIMNNTGLIVANELYPNRHVPLGHTLERLGVLNTVISGYQAQEFPLKNGFDYIMADVPCSGEGRFRISGNNLEHKIFSAKGKLSGLQKRIIVRGFDLLNSGGKMLYATCTYNPEENEAIVDHLLKERDAEVLPLDLAVPYEPGLLEWKDERYSSQLKRSGRFYPHRIDSVGFFMARIGKR